MNPLSRLIVGLAFAALVPVVVPWVENRRLARAGCATVLAVWTVLPAGIGVGNRVLAGLIIAVHLAVDIPTRKRVNLLLFGLALAFCSIVAVAVLYSTEATSRAIWQFLDNDRVLIVVSGALGAIFLVDALIAWLITPLSGQLTAQTAAKEVAEPKKVIDAGGNVEDVKPRSGLKDGDHQAVGAVSRASASRYIGWLERLLLYGAVVLGVPQAAILIVTLKSIARFSELTSEAFVEYFLVGTLLSLVGGIGFGIVIRAILGLSPL